MLFLRTVELLLAAHEAPAQPLEASFLGVGLEEAEGLLEEEGVVGDEPLPGFLLRDLM